MARALRDNALRAAHQFHQMSPSMQIAIFQTEKGGWQTCVGESLETLKRRKFTRIVDFVIIHEGVTRSPPRRHTA